MERVKKAILELLPFSPGIRRNCAALCCGFFGLKLDRNTKKSYERKLK
jgi:hypothetical protein